MLRIFFLDIKVAVVALVALKPLSFLENKIYKRLYIYSHLSHLSHSLKFPDRYNCTTGTINLVLCAKSQNI